MTQLGVRTIPGYVVHEQLEASLVTATYLASREDDGYPVVLQLVSDVTDDAARVTAFRETMEAVARVRHPVVPSVWEIGEADGLLYTISNAVEGRSLAAVLASRGRLPRDDTIAICTELADALDMLRSAGVTHGAISPHAVWINDRDRAPSAPYVSLRGYGAPALEAVRHRDEVDAPPPPDVLYVAPEQVRGDPTDHRCDQYALACMAVHCLTGGPLFERATTAALFDAHLHVGPDDGELHADELPPSMVAALRRALAKDPDDRFASPIAFAIAIGGSSQRSWNWMIEQRDERPAADAQPIMVALREIDITDDTGPAARATADAARDEASPHDEPADPVLTARSLAEADWLPGSATRTGPQRPVGGRTPLSRRRGPGAPVPPPPRRPPYGRWVAVSTGVVGIIIAAIFTGLALVRPIDTPAAGDAVQPAEGGVAREIEATWRRPVAQDRVSLLAAVDDDLISVSADTVASLDQETGEARWRASLGDAVVDLSPIGDTLIARTASQFYGLDSSTGRVRWRSGVTGVDDVDAFVTGRGRMFGVGTDDAGGMVIHAIDPRNGDVGWSIATDAADDGGADPTADPTPAVAFDGSERGGRSLYVLRDGRLYAFDTTTRQRRWRTPLSDPQPRSLTAVGGAVLVVGRDGRLCRYDAASGRPVWTSCPALQRPRSAAWIAQVRNSRVIVGSRHEMLSVDFTRGTANWRIVSTEPLQAPMAANRSTAFVAGPDGTVEAIAQDNGASLWESAPFGDITAMAATEEAVFVTTVDGRLTRLEAPDAPGADGADAQG